MHEPSTEGRARIRAPIPFDRYQKKRLMAGEQWKPWECVAFMSIFLDMTLIKTYWADYQLKTIEIKSISFSDILYFLFCFFDMITGRVYSLFGWIRDDPLYSTKRTFCDKNTRVIKQAVLVFLSFLLFLDGSPTIWCTFF